MVSPDGDSLFLQTPKKVSKKTLAPTFGPRKLGFLRSGIDSGAAATVCFAAPPSAVYDFVVRSLRSHARINPSTQPSDVAGGSRSKAGELTLGLLSGEKRRMALDLWWGCPSSERRPPSPLPREREPILVGFEICIRLGIARWRISRIHHGQSPLPLGEG
jgi:hypothetical protein